MNRKLIAIIGGVVLSLAAVTFGAYLLMRGMSFDILQPAGHIARRERDIIVFVVILAAIVVIPVFAMLFIFAYRYRESNHRKAVYKPDWDDNVWLEVVWWGIPIIIVIILAVLTWQTSHELDPYKDLDSSVSDKAAVEVEVIALEWKWLFLYPDLGVASAGELMIPADTPVNFTITSDAPMNSFWIPKLGGQIYAMSAMSTELSLIADEPGEYRGYSANISGEGFAGMKFITKATERSQFDKWVAQAQLAPALDITSYNQLAEKSILEHPKTYSLIDKKLYDKVIDKYMMSDQAYQAKYHEPKPATHDGQDHSAGTTKQHHTDMKGMN